MRLRHFLIIALELVVVLGVLDVAGLHTFDELAIVGYLLIYFIPAVALFAVSVAGIGKDAGVMRGLDIVGAVTGAGSILLAFGHFLG